VLTKSIDIKPTAKAYYQRAIFLSKLGKPEMNCEIKENLKIAHLLSPEEKLYEKAFAEYDLK